MIELLYTPVALSGGRLVPAAEAGGASRERTMAARILAAHGVTSNGRLRVKFDALASHDITYVGIVQTARASGMTRFPMPYALTNCHNSLCAVGGTINEDDHAFGLSAAVKYGGIYVPAHQAVIHQYVRETMAKPGGMILGSDSHTRYGALGCMGVGEGGPELVKQLLGQTWDLAEPEVIAVELTGAPRRGVGPQDVALALIARVFERGFAKNKVMEFIGPGAQGLSVEYRMGIDVMTTETTCLSSIWPTDEKVRAYLAIHGREEDYKDIRPGEGALYDGAIQIDLSEIRPMIALPFHPSNALPIDEFLQDPMARLAEIEARAAQLMKKGAPPRLSDKVRGGDVYVDQAVIAGCSGGMFENLTDAADMLLGRSAGAGEFSLSVYPSSQPQMMALMRDGALAELMAAGASARSAFCGPCFGAGDVPMHGGFSIRHTTRNFENREGARPSDGQIAYVALMDARSIAATAANGGRLTPADRFEWSSRPHTYSFDRASYDARVYFGWGKPQPEQNLVFGPNIADWPEMIPLPENLILTVASSLCDPVTTTDELIPSGETSSYRSNPMKLAEFALSRRDPGYVARAKAEAALERARRAGEMSEALSAKLALSGRDPAEAAADTGIGSLVFAFKPGDGSAREQAASCQRVLGGCANVAAEYATKRYRSNVVNWGMLPFVLDGARERSLVVGDVIYLPGVRGAVLSGAERVEGTLIRGGERTPIELKLPGLSQDEREVLLAGCLINYYKAVNA